MDPDQTARMRMLVWIHAGRKRIMLVLSWRGSFLKPVKNTLTVVSSHSSVINLVQYFGFETLFVLGIDNYKSF
jgi:hypothetical protein